MRCLYRRPCKYILYILKYVLFLYIINYLLILLLLLYRAYETSKLYRDLKLRGSIVKDGELVLLPQEDIFAKINGVWNLSSEQGNLGTFFFTNVRVVWHANLATNFNVSLPYMQIKSVRLRDSKFGRALVLETFVKAGGYILGFRVDPQDRIGEVFQELNSLYQVYSVAPLFGVDFTIENEQKSPDQVLLPKIDEDIDIIDDLEDTHAVAAYYAQGDIDDASKFESIQYDSRLGLAVESLVDGITLEQLWRVV